MFPRSKLYIIIWKLRQVSSHLFDLLLKLEIERYSQPQASLSCRFVFETLHSEGQYQKQDFRKEIAGSRKDSSSSPDFQEYAKQCHITSGKFRFESVDVLSLNYVFSKLYEDPQEILMEFYSLNLLPF